MLGVGVGDGVDVGYYFVVIYVDVVVVYGDGVCCFILVYVDV